MIPRFFEPEMRKINPLLRKKITVCLVTLSAQMHHYCRTNTITTVNIYKDAKLCAIASHLYLF